MINLYYFDYEYMLYILAGIVLAMLASGSVKSSFAKYSSVFSLRGITGQQAAEMVLRDNGVYGVTIERVAGSLTDHYDPRSNVIRLSDTVYNSTSVAAIGVAAHEAGHAVQYANNYAPIKIRAKLLPITNFGSRLSVPLIILGYFLSVLELVYIGIALFSFVVLFTLVTLPVEFNASHRAVNAISQLNILDDNEIKGVKKVLSAAAMTYVASFIQNLLILIYYVVQTRRRR